MKCRKCGTELEENIKFCSNCGEKIAVEESKEKKFNFWKKLNTYEKIATIAVTIFVIMCAVALLNGKVGAGIIAIVEIGFIVVAILMEKKIIKTPKEWLPTAMIILSFALVVPYIGIFNEDYEEAKTFRWDDIVLGDVIPETPSSLGEIRNNSKKYLSLYLYKVSSSQYNDYVTACREKGFTVDLEQMSSSFYAYNDLGHKLSLSYNERKKRMDISVEAPEELGTLEWPDNEYTKLIPTPTSKIGKIEKNDNTGLTVLVGKTSKEDFKAYTKACIDKGFSVDVYESDKYYSAQNVNENKINIDYRGNQTMRISIYEPEYKIEFEVNCTENLLFSKYDVQVYIDDLNRGTLKHGTTETYTETLKKGTHRLKFINADDKSVKGEAEVNIQKSETVKVSIDCTSSQINVSVSNSYTEEEKKKPLTTIDVKGLDLETAKNKLKEIGFTNVNAKAENDSDVIIIDSNWNVVEQNFEVGTEIAKNTEIMLTCRHKEEEKNRETTTTESKETETTTPIVEEKVDDFSDTDHHIDAKEAFEEMVEAQYPYGVKFHWIVGLLADTYEGNGNWFFKVEVTIKNEYNAKRKAVAEGRVNVTNGAKVTYCVVY